MANFFQNKTNFLYHLIFREEMSEKVKLFLKNISYVGFGTVIVGFLSFIFNVLAGRILGPTEYGKFALVSSIAMILYIPMMPGLNTAMVKYVSEKDDFYQQSRIISTTFILIVPFLFISTLLYFIFVPQLSKILSISPEIFILSVVFSLSFVLYVLTIEIMRAVDKMKAFAISRTWYGIVLILAFAFFVINNYISFEAAVFSTCAAYLIVAFVSFLFYIRKFLRVSFDKLWANKLIIYSFWAVIGLAAYSIYNSLDKILINKYLTTSKVGIYEAYQFASINVTILIFGVFNTVFFPTASRHENKKNLFKKINKFLPYLVILGIPFIFFCEFIILKFYGGNYPFNPLWAMLLGVACVLIFIDGTYSWTLTSAGGKGIRLVSIAYILFAVVDIISSIKLIPVFGITGAIISIILAFTTSITINVIFGIKYL